MTIGDVLSVAGGRTKVVIYCDGKDPYEEVWRGIVDDIPFPEVPFGDREVSHLTVINEEDILQLHCQ